MLMKPHRALHLVHLGARGDMEGFAPRLGDLLLLQPVIRRRTQHLSLRLDERLGPLRFDQGVVEDSEPSVRHTSPCGRRLDFRGCDARREAFERGVPGREHDGLEGGDVSVSLRSELLERQQLAIQVEQHRVLRAFEHVPKARVERAGSRSIPASRREKLAQRLWRDGNRFRILPHQFGPFLDGLLPGVPKIVELLLHGALRVHRAGRARRLDREHGPQERLLTRCPRVGPGAGGVAHSNTTTCRIALPSWSRSKPWLMSSSGRRPVKSLFTGSRPCVYRSMYLGMSRDGTHVPI